MEASLEAEFQKRWNHAVHYAFRILRNESDAEDAVQRAYTNALRKADQFKGDANWQTWFFTIVRRQALMILREKRACRIDFVETLYESAYERPHFDTPERLAMSTERLELIRQRIHRLSPKLQSAMLYAIGQAGGRPLPGEEKRRTSTDKGRLHRARTELREMLTKDGLEEVIL